MSKEAVLGAVRRGLRRGPLPEDKGQFGRDVATEDFRPLAD